MIIGPASANNARTDTVGGDAVVVDSDMFVGVPQNSQQRN